MNVKRFQTEEHYNWVPVDLCCVFFLRHYKNVNLENRLNISMQITPGKHTPGNQIYGTFYILTRFFACYRLSLWEIMFHIPLLPPH